MGLSPAHSKNFLVTVSSLSLPLTISSVIQVSSVIRSGICLPGSINSSKVSIIAPSLSFTAPISII